MYDWTWQKSGTLDQYVVPWGMRRVLGWIKGMLRECPCVHENKNAPDRALSSFCHICHMHCDNVCIVDQPLNLQSFIFLTELVSSIPVF